MLLKIVLFICLFHGQIDNLLGARGLKNYIVLKQHYRSRNPTYSYKNTNIKRFFIEDADVPWNVTPSKPYNPPEYTADEVKSGPPWADPEIGDPKWVTKKPKWNRFNGHMNRQCGSHIYKLADGYPLNPIGRTGLRGRGVLGRWGPNHQAHVVVARWKKHANNTIMIHKGTKKPMIEVVAVERDEESEPFPIKPWSVPGCFKDPDETYMTTLVKCFIKEALNDFEKCPGDRATNIEKFTKFFSNASLLYRGYVDDPRNTDNAWISTAAFLVIDEQDDFMKSFPLSPGKPLLKAEWLEAGTFFYKIMYANHLDFIHVAADLLDAHCCNPYLDSAELMGTDSSLDRFVNESADMANYDFTDTHPSQVTSLGLTKVDESKIPSRYSSPSYITNSSSETSVSSFPSWDVSVK